VKELGPGDGKSLDANVMAGGGAALSPQKSDLALLRNANVSLFHACRTYFSYFFQIASVLINFCQLLCIVQFVKSVACDYKAIVNIMTSPQVLPPRELF